MLLVIFLKLLFFLLSQDQWMQEWIYLQNCSVNSQQSKHSVTFTEVTCFALYIEKNVSSCFGSINSPGLDMVVIFKRRGLFTENKKYIMVTKQYRVHEIIYQRPWAKISKTRDNISACERTCRGQEIIDFGQNLKYILTARYYIEAMR